MNYINAGQYSKGSLKATLESEKGYSLKAKF